MEYIPQEWVQKVFQCAIYQIFPTGVEMNIITFYSETMNGTISIKRDTYTEPNFKAAPGQTPGIF